MFNMIVLNQIVSDNDQDDVAEAGPGDGEDAISEQETLQNDISMPMKPEQILVSMVKTRLKSLSVI
jgi:hypothetical protein